MYNIGIIENIETKYNIIHEGIYEWIYPPV